MPQQQKTILKPEKHMPQQQKTSLKPQSHTLLVEKIVLCHPCSSMYIIITPHLWTACLKCWLVAYQCLPQLYTHIYIYIQQENNGGTVEALIKNRTLWRTTTHLLSRPPLPCPPPLKTTTFLLYNLFLHKWVLDQNHSPTPPYFYIYFLQSLFFHISMKTNPWPGTTLL